MASFSSAETAGSEAEKSWRHPRSLSRAVCHCKPQRTKGETLRWALRAEGARPPESCWPWQDLVFILREPLKLERILREKVEWLIGFTFKTIPLWQKEAGGAGVECWKLGDYGAVLARSEGGLEIQREMVRLQTHSKDRNLTSWMQPSYKRGRGLLPREKSWTMSLNPSFPEVRIYERRLGQKSNFHLND